jgi:hypothetical protein
MTMHFSRTLRADLLSRPPSCADRAGQWQRSMIDPVAQLRELEDLLSKGLLTRQEFDRQKAKVLGEPLDA